MPYYRITVTTMDGEVKKGVRFDYLTDIDAYFQKAHRRAFLHYKLMLKSVEVVMLVSFCDEVKAYIKAEQDKQMQRALQKPSQTFNNITQFNGKGKFDAYNTRKEEGEKPHQ